MKKIFSILTVGLVALATFSCVKEEFATFDETKATAPVLGSYEVGEKAITATFTPGAFNMGFNDKQYANVVLNKIPRGYYMKGELCVYQGVYKPTWELAQSNYQIVQQYIPDLCALFNLKDNSNLYLGVRVGRVGEVWERINKTTIGNFMRIR